MSQGVVIRSCLPKTAWPRLLDQTTLDLSEDNYVQNRILKAKYTFLYNEARHRGTRFSGITNAITQ